MKKKVNIMDYKLNERINELNERINELENHYFMLRAQSSENIKQIKNIRYVLTYAFGIMPLIVISILIIVKIISISIIVKKFI